MKQKHALRKKIKNCNMLENLIKNELRGFTDLRLPEIKAKYL